MEYDLDDVTQVKLPGCYRIVCVQNIIYDELGYDSCVTRYYSYRKLVCRFELTMLAYRPFRLGCTVS